MIFSKPLLGTDTDKVKLSWIEYIWSCCILQGWYNCCCSFRIWADLIGNSYQGYGILSEDDDLEQCILYLWNSLEDEIYSKKFLEHLLQLVDDVKTGKEKLIPMDDVMADLKKMYEEEDDD
jgi:hypothetical protein